MAKFFFPVAMFLVLFVITGIFTFGKISAILFDPNDKLEIVQPAANSTVRGNVTLGFLAYDSSSQLRSSLPVKIEINDITCKTHLRTIINANRPNVSSVQNIAWNTTAGYSDGAVLEDNSYCLRICSDFTRDGGAPYAACESREIRIRNVKNDAPVFKSKPTTSVFVGDNYSYALQATDSDNDPLTYSAVQKPGFLTFSGNTLSGKNLTVVGDYTIVVEARDTYNGSVTQTYKLSIKEKPVAEVTPAPTPIPSTVQISFTFPTANAEVNRTNNKISWALSNLPADANRLDLQYRPSTSTSEEAWKNLISYDKTQLETTRSFTWDITSVPDGNYQLRLNVATPTDTYQSLSPSFPVDSKGTDPVVNPDTVGIFEIKPNNGSAITTVRPEISALINIGEFAEIANSDIKLLVNETDYSALCKLEPGTAAKSYRLKCTLDTDLTPADYKVKLSVKRSLNGVDLDLNREWQFTLVKGDATNTDNIQILFLSLPRQTFLTIGTILLGLVCLVLLPLTLFTIWKRRVANRSESYSSVTSSSSSGGTTPPGGYTSTRPTAAASMLNPAQQTELELAAAYNKTKAPTPTPAPAAKPSIFKALQPAPKPAPIAPAVVAKPIPQVNPTQPAPATPKGPNPIAAGISGLGSRVSSGISSIKSGVQEKAQQKAAEQTAKKEAQAAKPLQPVPVVIPAPVAPATKPQSTADLLGGSTSLPMAASPVKPNPPKSFEQPKPIETKPIEIKQEEPKPIPAAPVAPAVPKVAPVEEPVQVKTPEPTVLMKASLPPLPAEAPVSIVKAEPVAPSAPLIMPSKPVVEDAGPLAPRLQPEKPLSEVVAKPSDEDLPAWLKDIPTPESPAAASAPTSSKETDGNKNKPSDPGDDSADPYGFGDFDIGR